MGGEERLVLKLEHGEVDARGDELDRGGKLVPRLVGLHLHLAGVNRDMRVGEDAVALDDHARAADLIRGLLRPGFEGVWVTHRGENLHDGIFHRRGRGRGGSSSSGGGGRGCRFGLRIRRTGGRSGQQGQKKDRGQGVDWTEVGTVAHAPATNEAMWEKDQSGVGAGH